MYCSGCGLVLAPGQGFCPQCGRPSAPPVPPVPGMEFELQNYAGKIRALSVVWFIYAAFSLLSGIAALTFASAFLSGHFGPWFQSPHGPWSNGNMPPFWFGPALLHLVWVFLFLRVGLALVAGFGLLERTEWGRIVAIIVAIISLIKFPFGTAIGIWTLVMLLGYRNSTLYQQL
jgi:hypothetical protein